MMMENGEGGEREGEKEGRRGWEKLGREGKRRKSVSFMDWTVSECRLSCKQL